jgi:DNA-binding Lrp family transcriptional regulator
VADEPTPSRPLDAIDRTIIRLLTADGRLSVNELANRANISRASAYSRLERLRAAGVIEGFTAIVNPNKVGLDIAALIFVNADQHGWKTLQHKLLDLPGLEHLAVTTGTFDFCLLVRVADMQTLRDVVLERLQAIPEMRATHTAFVLDEHRPPPVTD